MKSSLIFQEKQGSMQFFSLMYEIKIIIKNKEIMTVVKKNNVLSKSTIILQSVVLDFFYCQGAWEEEEKEEEGEEKEKYPAMSRELCVIQLCKCFY